MRTSRAAYGIKKHRFGDVDTVQHSDECRRNEQYNFNQRHIRIFFFAGVMDVCLVWESNRYGR